MNNDIKKKRGNTMLISSISSYSQNNLPKQNITRNKNINFESTYIKPQGPKFKTKHIEEVYNKMYKYFNIVGLYGKLKAPLIVEVNGTKYGIDCNRKNPEQQRIIIKDKINSIEDWNKLQPEQSIVEFNFNEFGKLDNGTFTKTEKDGYCRNAFYRRESRSHRQLQIEGITYRPTRNNDTIWASVPELSYCSVNHDIDIFERFKDVELAELFLEFTKPYREILPATKE